MTASPASLATFAATGPVRDSADVGRARERSRLRRVAVLGAMLVPVLVWLWAPIITSQPLFVPTMPEVDPMYVIVGVFFLVMLIAAVGTSVVAGKSPHVTYRPEQIDVRMADLQGVGPLREEVSRSLDLFLANRTFRDTMGGTPRRGLLFEGSPGTGKTMMAKAMAAEAGVPFLFVSATSFQSMYYGATARKIRSYFRAVRKAARAEGGAIAFIEEIDAVATIRGGMRGNQFSPLQAPFQGLPALPLVSPHAEGGSETVHSVTSEGVGGVVNEFLVQMQSFDEPTGVQKLQSALVDVVNQFLPAQRQFKRPTPAKTNILVIAATNRADNLDPALLRPGRFDRRLTFGLPDKAGRRELIDYYLAKKSHGPELADPEYRDALAGVTQGFSPAEIENLLDEGLVNAVRRGDTAMNWKDLEHARMLIQVGLGQPVGYTEHEQRLIATHEAGHAVIAHLEAPQRRLEILTIVKRAGALGMLAHGDAEDVYTRSSSELRALIRIALGGMVAEEMFFGDTTTGPTGDLSYATTVAAQMIGGAGMSGSLISYAAPGGGGDLVGRVLSHDAARAKVEALLQEQRDRVRELMTEHRHLVEALRDALLERHELIGHEITDVLAAAQPKCVVDVTDAAVQSALPAVSTDGSGADEDGK